MRLGTAQSLPRPGRYHLAVNVLLLQRWLRDEGPALIGARLRGVAQLDAKSIALELRSEDGQRELLLSVREDCPTLALLPVGAGPAPTPDLEPGGFAKALAHQLNGWTLIGLQQDGFERSVVFRFYHKDAYGREAHKQLRLELAGRASNAYLISERGMVVSMLKRVRPGMNRVREVKTGKPLPPPPPLGKFIAAEQDSAALGAELAALAGAEGVAGGGALRELLTRRIAGGEVKLWAALEPLLPVAYDLDTLHRFIAELQSGEYTGQLFGLGGPGDANRVALEAWHGAAGAAGGGPQRTHGHEPDGRPPAAPTAVQAQLALAQRADELESLGLELMAQAEALDAAGAAPQHMAAWQATHPDWAAQADPLASVADNAQRLVNYAQRLRRGKEKLEAKLAELSRGGPRAAVDRDGDRSVAATGIGGTGAAAIQTKLERRGVKHLRFTSSDGLAILCGVSDAGNDGLVREFGNARHVWLHARDFAGSHVIILSNGRDVPHRTLEEAATVAAYHSKGQREHEVEVNYVPMKHVRKPKGAKPGLVFISHEKVIRVRPERFEEWRTHLLRAAE
jgi:predicted ribosome quality control (RQC) complex YloA/Tae2 family protein